MNPCRIPCQQECRMDSARSSAPLLGIFVEGLRSCKVRGPSEFPDPTLSTTLKLEAGVGKSTRQKPEQKIWILMGKRGAEDQKQKGYLRQGKDNYKNKSKGKYEDKNSLRNKIVLRKLGMLTLLERQHKRLAAFSPPKGGEI